MGIWVDTDWVGISLIVEKVLWGLTALILAYFIYDLYLRKKEKGVIA